MNIVESLRRRVTPAHRHPAHDAAALLAQLSDAHYPRFFVSAGFMGAKP